MEILGMVPARGGSKGGSQEKHKAPGRGAAYCLYIREAQKSLYITRIVASTEDEDIACY
jgi:CMP-N-acetylneuraminic acid synthetase